MSVGFGDVLMARYVISGLRVASDLDLPGALPAPASGDDVDLTIAAGPVPASLDQAEQLGPNWQLAGDRFLLRVPGIVRILLEGPAVLRWQCEGDTSPEDAAIFVCGSGIGLSLHLRGRCVLHASAVAVGDRAVLFCGPSGAGKSTLAAALAARRYSLLADDQCVLTETGAGDLSVHPDGRAMKLWHEAIEQLTLQPRRGAAVRTRVEKFYVEPEVALSHPLPLGAIYILGEDHAIAGGAADGMEGREIAITRFNLADAARVMRANAYRPAMVRRLGQAGLYLQAAASAMQSAGIYQLARPLDFGRMDAVVTELERHWSDLGIGEQRA